MRKLSFYSLNWTAMMLFALGSSACSDDTVQTGGKPVNEDMEQRRDSGQTQVDMSPSADLGKDQGAQDLSEADLSKEEEMGPPGEMGVDDMDQVDSGTQTDMDVRQGFGDILNGSWSTQFNLAGASGGIGSSVRAVALKDNDIYAGGLFSFMSGAPAQNVAKWSGTQWEALGQGVDLLVLALESQTASPNLYVGGQAQSSFGLPAPNAVKLWNGALWSDFALVDGAFTKVHAIKVLRDGRIAVGGQFEGIAGVTAPNLAIWDGSTWSAWGSKVVMEDEIFSIIEDTNGRPCIGGRFGDRPFTQGRGVACWDEQESDWKGLLGDLPPGVVMTMLGDGPGGELIVGGSFTYFDQALGVRAGLARWDGTMWSAFGGGVDGGDVNSVRALARDAQGRLLVGGRFGVLDPTGTAVRAQSLGRWDGTKWEAVGDLTDPLEVFVPGLAGVHAIAVKGNGDVVLGGIMLRVNEIISSGIALLDAMGWKQLKSANVMTQGLGGPAFKVATGIQNDVYVFGEFNDAGGVPARRLARWINDSWEAVGDGLGPEVQIAVMKVNPVTGDLWLGGEFTLGAPGAQAVNLARWDGTQWESIGGAPDAGVTDINFDAQGNAYISGTFNAIGATSAKRVARWSGTQWEALGDGLGANDQEGVAKIALSPGGVVWAAGNFQSTGKGEVARGFARWDGNKWSEAGGGLGNDTAVFDLKPYKQGVVIAGRFLGASDGTRLNSIGYWDGSKWNAFGDGLQAFEMFARAISIVISGDQIIATGTFRFGEDEDHLAWWDGSKWSPIGKGLSDLAESLAVSGETLWIAGLFNKAGDNTPSFGLARWQWGMEK